MGNGREKGDAIPYERTEKGRPAQEHWEKRLSKEGILFHDHFERFFTTHFGVR